MIRLTIVTGILLILLSSIPVLSQTIPYGISLDSVIFDNFALTNTQSFHCFKPTTYNSNSPIIIAIHGSGGNGISAINDLDSIATRRNALIIAPNFAASGFKGTMRHQEPVMVYVDSLNLCVVLRPATDVLKKIYESVLFKENRSSMLTYLIGFSAGGQFVSRYMLIRQAYPDSIPLQMAVSSNAYYYTFPTDSFLGISMPWLCGIGIMPPTTIGDCFRQKDMYVWNCPEHVIQYYNENYAVLIGTGDVSPLNDNACAMIQGNNRYERAQTFFNFCDSNATNRGTSLQWLYQEIPGVGHDQYAMYNNKFFPTDTSTIAESLLFDTPYHPVLFNSPVASFHSDTVIVDINVPVQFINTSIYSTSYLWNFGDSTSSSLENPSHSFTNFGTYTIQLTAFNDSLCDNFLEKRHYIKVVDPLSIVDYISNKMSIFPNPSQAIIVVNLNSKSEYFNFIIYDILGKEIKNLKIKNYSKIDIEDLPNGCYFYHINDSGNYTESGKIIKI